MQDEIKQHLAESGESRGHNSDTLIGARFKEMCALSKNSLVSFKHFLFAVDRHRYVQ